MSKERLDYVDILKGIGILFVIFSHSGAEEWLMSNMGDFFVPLFFIASGYTYRYSNHSLREAFAKRVKRLLKPYFFFSILMLLLYKRSSLFDIVGVFYSRYCLFPYYTTDNIILLGGGNPPLWFLTSMITASVPFFLLMKYPKYDKWFLCVFILYTFSCQYLPILLPWSMDTACLTGAFMYAGMLLRKDMKLLERSWPFYIAIFLLFFCACLLNGGDNLSVREYGRSFLLYYLASVLGTVFLLKISQFLERTPLCDVMVSVGRHSLVIFGIQMFLLRLCHQLFHGLLHMPTEGWVFYLISLMKVLLVAITGVYISKTMNKYIPWVFK